MFRFDQRRRWKGIGWRYLRISTQRDKKNELIDFMDLSEINRRGEGPGRWKVEQIRWEICGESTGNGDKNKVEIWRVKTINVRSGEFYAKLTVV